MATRVVALSKKNLSPATPTNFFAGLETIQLTSALLEHRDDATVIMNKVDYVNKANAIFSDKEAYAILAEVMTKKQAAAIKKKVTELTRLKFISPDDSKCMTLSDPRIIHAHGLSKVPKTYVPLRTIVSFI
ncbi:unnamed protein product [Schistocephalus solidus]|uniref:Uncharacterized protein n=1 Tax=Schistocephalus solidus TaxID=70667 RepID=A0A183SDJ5_SCHSO|nr:unnamed protein product [Schistocephalus solidus]